MSSPKRILQVIPTLSPSAGGPVEGLIQQGKQLANRGWSVHTLSLDLPGTALDSRLAADAVFQLGPTLGNYGLSSRLEPWLREFGRNYDVIIVHGLWGYHGYTVAKVARSENLRYVVIPHGMLDPWFKNAYPLKHLKKWLYWPWAEYRVLRDASLVLFTTAEELRLARESFWLYAARERLVGYGIAKPTTTPADVESFLSAYQHLRGKRILLFLSRLHEKKGCELLIRAFAGIAAAATDLHLVIAGAGDADYTAMLHKLVTRLGIEARVTFTGMLRDERKWGALASAEAFALPSHQENFGIAVAEALAMGVPVLTTTGVNIWREIKDAGAGLIGQDTQESVSDLLTQWLSFDPAKRAQMKINAVSCFTDHFLIDNVAGNLAQALDDVRRGPREEHSYVGYAKSRENSR
jgi:glycosyltransferase involved in cell wall biosynthesis